MRTTTVIGAFLAALATCLPASGDANHLERRQFGDFLSGMSMSDLQVGLDMFGGIQGIATMKADPVKVEDLQPTIRKDALKKRLWFGPYTLPAIAKGAAASAMAGHHMAGPSVPAAPGKKKPLQMDPNSVQLNKQLASGWCTDCTVLASKSVLTYANGTVADVHGGVYEHHVVVIDMAKRGGYPFYLCEGQKGFLGKMPAKGFIVSGNDLAANMFTNPDGSFDSGYYVGKSPMMIMQAELVNYLETPQEIYVTFEYEYLPGKVAKNDASVTLFSVTGCDFPDYHAPKDQPQYNISSARVPIPQDGYIINAKGHLHDGGVNVLLTVNDKVVCDSKAVYGADSQATSSLAPNGKRWEVITEMTQCTEPVPIKKGDILQINTFYDNALHPPRSAADGHSGDSDEMGVYFLNMATTSA